MPLQTTFLAELQRRNVHRAALFYAGAAWLIVQVATQVFPFFDIASSVVRAVILVLLIGFPFAMIFSWFYEWTPQGIRRESEIDRDESVTRQTGKKLDKAIIAVLSLAVIVLLADRFLLHKADVEVADKSIAVLPFVNTSDDAGNEYFSDGLSEELISSLARLSNLKVIGRTSSFQFKNKTDDSKAIGEKLGVVYLLEGSVRKSADRVRIAVALVKSIDGASVWSETYDRELKDIFAVQTEIAGAVATALKIALLGNNAQTVLAPSVTVPSNQNLDAYNALLQGDFYRQRSTIEDTRRSIEYYLEAIRFDPGYALAYAKLSLAYEAFWSSFAEARAKTQHAREKSRAAADMALKLDPNLAEAHVALGLSLLMVDLVRTEAEYQRAVELAPQNATAIRTLCFLYGALGRLDQAAEFGRRAVQLDPLSSNSRYQLARVLAGRGDYDEAEAVLRKSIELQPEASRIHMQLAVLQILRGDAAGALELARQETDSFWRTYALALSSFAAGDRPQADAQLAKLIAEYADNGAAQIAIIYAQRREPQQMFEWLERGWLAEDQGVRLLLVDRFLLAYKDDPRFIAFAIKTGVMPATGTSP